MSIVERVKALKTKAGEPYSGFSVTRCVELLLGEVLTSLETHSRDSSFPFYRKFLDAMPAPSAEQEITDEDLEKVAAGYGIGESIIVTPSAKPGAFVGKNEIRLADFVRDIVDKALKEREGTSAKVAEPPAAYTAKQKPAKK